MLTEKLQDLIDTYASIDDAQERMALVVDSATRRAELPQGRRTDAARVRGCISAAWIDANLVDGRCAFACAADSPLVQGLLSLLCTFFSGATPDEVVASELDPLEALGLTKNLSPTRRNGLASARRRIRELAVELAAGRTAS